MSNGLDRFIERCSVLLGAEHVLQAEEQRECYARTTLTAARRSPLILKPGNTAEVSAIVRAAAQFGISIYPFSCGNNWGYGDRQAPQPDTVLLDLGRLNRILEINTELAYAVLEPGVTQGQLFEHLQTNKIPLWMDCTGAGPDASIVGNMLERGFGHTVYGDRMSHSCNFEVVLPSGEIVSTGFGSFEKSQGQHIFKWGLGPALDGLFTQSNWGIVTKATVWLMPKPVSFSAFFLIAKRTQDIFEMIEVIRELQLAGVLNTRIHIFNDMRVLGGSTGYPWDRADGRKALEVDQPELCRALLKKFAIPVWVATGSFSGPRSIIKAAAKVLKREMRRRAPSIQVVQVSERLRDLLIEMKRYLPEWSFLAGFKKQLEKLDLGFEILKGRPLHETLIGAHWRARGAVKRTANPLDSGSGLLWFAPVLPPNRQALDAFLQLTRGIFHLHGFEFQLTLSFINPRALCAVMSVAYDKQNPEETTRAHACEQDLIKQTNAQGFYPYRCSIHAGTQYFDREGAYWQLLRRLKLTLDPERIFAPGRWGL